MTRRQSSFAYAALLLGVVAFASSLARPSSGQPGAPVPTEVGRYHIATGGSNNNYLYVIDSTDGRIWMRPVSAEKVKWVDIGTPFDGK